MNLTDAQKQKVAEWIAQGLKLSEIQNRVGSELGLRLTYMEVKMLLADLELKPKDQDRPKADAQIGLVAPTSAQAAGPQAAQGSVPPDDDAPLPPEAFPSGTPGSISVTVDTITRPGAMVSGKVTFSDQKTAEWHLDQYGRLGFAPSEKGYRPSQNDLLAFQNELQMQLAKMGY